MRPNYYKNTVPIFVTLGKICGAALAYCIAGRLSLYLAIPPGYASPIWPAAGIGLAAVLLLGYRACPGIFIGSLFVNLWTSYDPSSVETLYRSIAIACSIASGAALQAFFGSYLIRRFVGFPNPLEKQKDIILFLTLGAPISCLANATIGISTLVISGSIDPANFRVSWLHWWIGDAIGVLVFTPLILILLSNNNSVWKRRRMTVAVPLSFLFAMSVLFFIFARSWEQEKSIYEFTKKAESISSSLEKSIYNYMEAFHYTVSLNLSSEEVTSDEFKMFVSRTLTQNPEIQAISWNSVVKDKNRSLFEKKVVESSHKEFNIRERDANGNLIEAKKRDEYVVVTHIEPFEENKKAFGYDVASDTTRLESINKACDSGQPIATNKITLVQDNKELNGLLVFTPAYANVKPPGTVEERRKNITGYVVGVFKIDQMIEASIKENEKDGLKIYLIDFSAPKGKHLIYVNNEVNTEKLTTLFFKKQKNKDSHLPFWSDKISFAGRNWELQIVETLASVLTRQTWHVWFVLVGGILFTGIMGAFLLIITGRKALLEASLALQKRAEEELKDTQEHLLHTEKLSAIGKLSASFAHEFNNPLCGILFVLQTISEKDLNEKLDITEIEQINMAIKECNRMADLTRKLQDFNRPSPGITLKIDINETINEVLIMCRKRLQTNKISLGTHFDKKLPLIKAVPDQIKQVILNLIQNADDSISGRDGRIDITTYIDNTNVLIEIQDTGKGIFQSDISKIFEPFMTTKPTVKGTGLGLSICHGIIKKHGGKIKVKSQPGHGSTFTIILPMENELNIIA